MLAAVAPEEFARCLAQSTERGYVTAYRLLRNRDEARDACQEAARRAWAAQARYDTSRPFHAWFHVILKNHCLDVIRGRTRQVPDEDLDRRPADAGRSGPRAADQVLWDRARHRAVHEAVAQLPDDLRDIIELRHFGDLSYAELAAVLDCPEGTVMSRLYRARKALRALLGDDFQEAAS